ncbi:50S ribosomal protein L29 [Candidatus Woesearchaeota archaeon]|nr:50S ribosomal protein L29 [Candidatus Woesearchaeota archaeon]
MKAKELRALSEAELSAKEQELRKTLLKLYGQVSTGTPPKNPGEIRRSKRTIAQILTLRNEKTKKPEAKPVVNTAQKPAVKRPESQSPKQPREVRPKQ